MEKAISEMNEEELKQALLEVARGLGRIGEATCRQAIEGLDELDDDEAGVFTAQCWEYFA